MFKLLRKKEITKKIIWVIAILIIISFGFMGTANLLIGKSDANYAGKLFGKKVSITDFRKFYQSVRLQALLQFGDKFNEVQPYLNLEQQTWNHLMLRHESKKRKITVTDQEVVQYIQQYPFFQRDGQFDSLLYNDMLKNALRVPARRFEESVRDILKFQQLFNQETQTVSIPDSQVFDAYKIKHEEIQVSYVLLPFTEFQDENLFDAQQAQKYFDNHKVDFVIPNSINVDYIRFDLPTPTTSTSLTDDITDTNAPDQKEALAAIMPKAQTIAEALQNNANINAVANQFQEPLQTSGFFSMEKPLLNLGWSYELLNQLFQLKVGETLGPIETSEALFILQLKEERPAYLPEYAEAKDAVKEALLTQAANATAQQQSSIYLEKIQELLASSKIKDFAKAAKTLGLDIHQTPAFHRGQYLPTIGISRNFQEAAFNLTTENPLSTPIETDNGYCLLYLDNKAPIDMETYVKEKAQLTTNLLEQRKKESFELFLSQLRRQAHLESFLIQEDS